MIPRPCFQTRRHSRPRRSIRRRDVRKPPGAPKLVHISNSAAISIEAPTHHLVRCLLPKIYPPPNPGRHLLCRQSQVTLKSNQTSVVCATSGGATSKPLRFAQSIALTLESRGCYT